MLYLGSAKSQSDSQLKMYLWKASKRDVWCRFWCSSRMMGPVQSRWEKYGKLRILLHIVNGSVKVFSCLQVRILRTWRLPHAWKLLYLHQPNLFTWISNLFHFLPKFTHLSIGSSSAIWIFAATELQQTWQLILIHRKSINQRFFLCKAKCEDSTVWFVPYR